MMAATQGLLARSRVVLFLSNHQVPVARVELASLSAPDSKSGVFTVSPHGHSTGRSRTDKHLVLS
jgi:hypothetical protein